MARGLIQGRWYRDVSAAPSWREDAERFHRGGFSRAIDVQALAAEPQRFHLYVSWACPFANFDRL
jgi:glutathionyl-hydroquinone reductase